MKFAVERDGWYRLHVQYTATGRRNQEGVVLDGECLSNLFMPKERTETDIVTIELTAGEHVLRLYLDRRSPGGSIEVELLRDGALLSMEAKNPKKG